MVYDVTVIGAGVCGASIARELARYEGKILLLDKAADASFGVSKSNSGIVHGGFHHPSHMLKTRLEVQGMRLFPRLAEELGFDWSPCGILVAAYDPEEMEVLKKLYQRGLDNGIHTLELCDRDRMLELEPKLQPTVCGGFYAPEGGTVEPYTYVYKLLENALLNGVETRFNRRITGGKYESGIWTLTPENGEVIRTRFVVNAAGLFADEVSRVCGAEEFTIYPRKGEEYLLDRTCAARPEHVIFPVPVKHSKGVLVIPTAGGTTMIGPTADPIDDKEDTTTTPLHFRTILKKVQGMVQGVDPRSVITSFAGLRPVLESEDFYIEPSEKVPALIQVAGIQSPGLTASPAIGIFVRELLEKAGLELPLKTSFLPSLPPHRMIRRESTASLEQLHQDDPAWTNIICRCEKISEAEIVTAIRHGHTTVDGIKFYTRAGMGRCQGGFCAARILKIISRETGIPVTELTKRGGNSRICIGSLGDLEVKE